MRINPRFLTFDGKLHIMKKIVPLVFLFVVGKLFSQNSTVYIPVVFHVVYGNPAENVPDAQILQHLQSMNFDFSDTTCTNTYTKDANTNIQFFIAATDPNGNPTNGITRTSTTISSFSTNNNVKFSAFGGKDIWDNSKYLNIWICDLGTSMLAYAQPPGGPAATDGLVIHYKYINGGLAPFNFGRQGTHELGHWFGLKHPAGDCITDQDSLSDTPLQGSVTSAACTSSGIDSCSGMADSLLAKNFMQFSADACMCFFTPDQSARMWQTLNDTKSSLLSGLTGINDNYIENNISVFPNPTSGLFNVNISVPFNDLKVVVFNSFGQKITNTFSKATSFRLDLSDQPSGVYHINVLSDNFSIIKRLVVIK